MVKTLPVEGHWSWVRGKFATTITFKPILNNWNPPLDELKHTQDTFREINVAYAYTADAGAANIQTKSVKVPTNHWELKVRENSPCPPPFLPAQLANMPRTHLCTAFMYRIVVLCCITTKVKMISDKFIWGSPLMTNMNNKRPKYDSLMENLIIEDCEEIRYMDRLSYLMMTSTDHFIYFPLFCFVLKSNYSSKCRGYEKAKRRKPTYLILVRQRTAANTWYAEWNIWLEHWNMMRRSRKQKMSFLVYTWLKSGDSGRCWNNSL